MRRRPLAAAAGLVADLLLGEPPLRPHPVSAYGGLMERVETLAYADDRARGVLHAAVGVGVAAL
ncbi:MAG: cobalamin biosynthesis protein, partial [Acidimicrobiales bacterium]